MATPHESACRLSSRRNLLSKTDQVLLCHVARPTLGIPYNQNPDSCQGLRPKLIDRLHDSSPYAGKSFHTASHIRPLENPDSCQAFVESVETGQRAYSEAAANDLEVPSTLEKRHSIIAAIYFLGVICRAPSKNCKWRGPYCLPFHSDQGAAHAH